MDLFGSKKRIEEMVKTGIEHYFAQTGLDDARKSLQSAVADRIRTGIDYATLVTGLKEIAINVAREEVAKTLKDMRPAYIATREEFDPNQYTLMQEYCVKSDAVLYSIREEDLAHKLRARVLDIGAALGADVIVKDKLHTEYGRYEYKGYLNVTAYKRKPVIEQPIEPEAKVVVENPPAPIAIETLHATRRRKKDNP